MYLLGQNVPKIKNAQNLLKSGASDISSMPIYILMSKTIFKKYLRTVGPKLVPKLKVLTIYWNLAQLIFWTSWSRSWCQKLFLLDNTCWAQIGPKIESTQNLLKFGTIDISSVTIFILMSKIVFIKYLLPVRSKMVPNWYQIGTNLVVSRNLCHFIWDLK